MLEVTCGIIEQQSRILICQRSVEMTHPLKWEFPGGKVEANESKIACLAREIQEELGLIIQVGQSLSPVIHAYPTFTIALYPYLCTLVSGKLQLSEHQQAIWVSREELLHYDWAEADVPIVQQLRKQRTI